MKLTAEKILHLIWDDMEFEAYGLRADRSGLEIGTRLENSRQWFQDWQDHWGEFPADDYNADPEHPYNEDMGCWDDGELDGVCTIGIDKYASTVQDIETALNRIEAYIDDVRLRSTSSEAATARAATTSANRSSLTQSSLRN